MIQKHFFGVTCTIQNSIQLIQTYFSNIKSLNWQKYNIKNMQNYIKKEKIVSLVFKVAKALEFSITTVE